MSTQAEIVARIKRRLSRKNSTLLDADIADELAQVKEELEKKPYLPKWLFNSVQPTINVSHDKLDFNGNSDVPGFLKLWDDAPLSYLLTTSAAEPFQLIEKFVSMAKLIERWPSSTTVDATSRPVGFAVRSDRSILLRPVVGFPITYNIRYYKSSDVDTWCARESDVIMHQTGLEVAQFLRDQDAIAYFTQKLGTAMRTYMSRCTAEDMTGLSLNMGED